MSNEKVVGHIADVLIRRTQLVKTAPLGLEVGLWMSIDHIVRAYCRYWSKKDVRAINDLGNRLFNEDDPYLQNIGLTIQSTPETVAHLVDQGSHDNIQLQKNIFMFYLLNQNFIDKYREDQIYVFNIICAAEGLLRMSEALRQFNHPMAFDGESYIRSAPTEVQLALWSYADDPDLQDTMIQDIYGSGN